MRSHYKTAAVTALLLVVTWHLTGCENSESVRPPGTVVLNECEDLMNRGSQLYLDSLDDLTEGELHSVAAEEKLTKSIRFLKEGYEKSKQQLSSNSRLPNLFSEKLAKDYEMRAMALYNQKEYEKCISDCISYDVWMKNVKNGDSGTPSSKRYSARVPFLRGYSLWRLGKFQEARESFQLVHELEGNEPEWSKKVPPGYRQE